jgi:hypothetical protein
MESHFTVSNEQQASMISLLIGDRCKEMWNVKLLVL